MFPAIPLDSSTRSDYWHLVQCGRLRSIQTAISCLALLHRSLTVIFFRLDLKILASRHAVACMIAAIQSISVMLPLGLETILDMTGRANNVMRWQRSVWKPTFAIATFVL